MRSIVAIVGVIGASLGIAAAVVFGRDDRRLFVPPPEAVVESFTRQITTRR
ncbi:MAG TPA: hypothetical protein VNJ03_01670 [Vicinamibacterales bacterium]|nr:hypothetical protein [Vicinamibacterales bacterium]